MSDRDREATTPAAPPPWLCPGVLHRLEEVRNRAFACGRDALGAEEEVRAAAVALLPTLPQTRVDEAVVAVLPDPEGREAAHGRSQAPRAAEARLAPAATEEVVQALSHALRFGLDGKPRRSGWDFAAQLAAAQLVRHLTRAGFVVMRRPPQRPHSAP